VPRLLGRHSFPSCFGKLRLIDERGTERKLFGTDKACGSAHPGARGFDFPPCAAFWVVVCSTASSISTCCIRRCEVCTGLFRVVRDPIFFYAVRPSPDHTPSSYSGFAFDWRRAAPRWLGRGPRTDVYSQQRRTRAPKGEAASVRAVRVRGRRASAKSRPLARRS